MKFRFQMMIIAIAATLTVPATAAAMCGCMIPVDDPGAPESETLTSDATQVVLMRDGMTTVQTMQNRYEGPPEDFAVVIPTPSLLSPEDVNTLKPGVFDSVDRATAPVLMEYWQQDPCEFSGDRDANFGAEDSANSANNTVGGGEQPPSEPTVVVEAEFTSGEYNIQIVSATEGSSLEAWLTENGYRLPDGASTYLQPYIDMGMYFFLAKVDTTKVRTVDGKSVLSPLRFVYDTEEFMLPTRLGMLNSSGRQDLVVYTLGASRYEVSNRTTVTIPTNVEVRDAVVTDFGSFYDSLYERTIDSYGDSPVVTEYAGNPWVLDNQTVSSLGLDILSERNPQYFPETLTRLHMRYEKDGIGEDLVFASAEPIQGGIDTFNDRGFPDPTQFEQGTTAGGANNFRARYFITHAWTGAVNCDDPDYDRWGGNPNEGGGAPTMISALSPNTTGSTVFQATDRPVAELVTEDVPEIDLQPEFPGKGEISSCSSGGFGVAALPGAVIFLLALLGLRRRD